MSVGGSSSLVSVLRANGFGFVCSMCHHMWDAYAAGHASCGMDCGGPLSGRSFPAYNGPLTLKRDYCFVCGETPKYEISCLSGTVGCCEQHIDVLKYSRSKNQNKTIIGDQ